MTNKHPKKKTAKKQPLLLSFWLPEEWRMKNEEWRMMNAGQITPAPSNKF